MDPGRYGCRWLRKLQHIGPHLRVGDLKESGGEEASGEKAEEKGWRGEIETDRRRAQIIR